jgi:hypothetical protein
MPRPCRAALIHACHAAPLPFSDSAVSFVKVRVVAENIRTASRTVKQIGMVLTSITTFVELRVVAGRSRTRAGRPLAVPGRPMVIHTCHAHAALCRGLEKSFSERNGRFMGGARHGMCESNTAALCKSNGKDTARWRSGWGTALRTGRSPDRFSMVSLEFFIDIFLPALGSNQPLIEMSTRNISPGGQGGVKAVGA